MNITCVFSMDEKNRIYFSQGIINFIKKCFGNELEIMAWKDKHSPLGYKIVLTPNKPDSIPFILVRPDKLNRVTIPQEIMSLPNFSTVKNKKGRVTCQISKNYRLIIIRF